MKTPAIKTQNNQVMPAGSRLWTPANIGGDLVYWLQPSGISAAVGTDTETLTNVNRWMDSSFNGFVPPKYKVYDYWHHIWNAIRTEFQVYGCKGWFWRWWWIFQRF